MERNETTPLPRPAAGAGAEAPLWVMHCAEGPVPQVAATAVAAFFAKETAPWEISWEGDFIGLPARVKAAAGQLLGAAPADLSLVATTSAGLAAVAQGFPWQAGDEVVVPLGEFPSNYWPWRALASRGVHVRQVPLWPGHRAGQAAWQSTPPPVDVEPEAILLGALSPRTRMLAVSWVRFQDGLKLDLERLAAGSKVRGVALVVDGIQGAGTLPISLGSPLLSGLSAFVSGGHKGLLAPQGLGVAWTEPEFRQRLAPPGGWLSVAEATNFNRPSTDFARAWKEDGSRLELGVPNLVGCAALAASLELLAGAGVAEVAAHVARLEVELLSGLAASAAWRVEAGRLYQLLEAGRVGSILAFHHGDRGPAGLDQLLRAGFARGIWASVREGYLRVALHGWHDAGDVQRLLEWLREA